MEGESSNKEQSMAQDPPQDKNLLNDSIKDLIESLEELLCIKYPLRPPTPTIQTGKTQMLMEIAKLLIGYHQLTSENEIASDQTACQWLNLQSKDIPTPEEIFRQLENPYITTLLARKGLARYRFPLLDFKQRNPSPYPITLTEHETICYLEGYQKISYLYTAVDIVQAQIAITTETNIYSEVFSYQVKFGIGKTNSFSTLPTASNPFQHPTSLSILVYNVLGAESTSFMEHIEGIVRDCAPMIIILTETRLDRAEAHQLAIDIGYHQVIAQSPMNYNGGIWIFSNLHNLSMKLLLCTDREIIVNLLKM